MCVSVLEVTGVLVKVSCGVAKLSFGWEWDQNNEEVRDVGQEKKEV